MRNIESEEAERESKRERESLERESCRERKKELQRREREREREEMGVGSEPKIGAERERGERNKRVRSAFLRESRKSTLESGEPRRLILHFGFFPF